jgi:anti-sigma factor RsiW
LRRLPARGSCREVVELAADHLDGALDPKARARLDRHLRDCDGCVTYLERLRTSIRIAGRLAPGAIPDATMSRLVAALRSWPRR